jgi:adhesin transport system outer membrane protein
MKISFKSILAAFLAGFFGFGTSVASAETLQNAIGHLLKTNPDINAVSYNKQAREKEVIQAKSGYYPKIDFSYALGVNEQSHPYYDKSEPESAVLSYRQNIFNFGTTTNEMYRQMNRVKSAAYKLQGTSENVALDAASVYLNLLRRLELFCLAVENLTNHERIYDQMKLRSESGVDRTSDLDQVMGRLALAQSNVVIAKANVVDAKTDYQSIIGYLPQEELTMPDSLEKVIPITMEETVQLALKDNPTLTSAKADLEARESQHAVAKSIALPTLDIAADYKWEDEVERDGYEEEWTASAIVNVNLFNGMADKARIDETQLLIYEALEILNSTQREVVQSVRLSWEARKAAIGKVAHLEEYVKAAGLTKDAFGKQWAIGRRTMFDVLDTEAELINAKVSLVNAKYDQLISEYRILSGMGKLVHSVGLEWPEDAGVTMAGNGK